MASMAYFKDIKRWRVFWHVTLPNGEVDKGSRSFKTKKEAKGFKDHCEKREKQLKRARLVDQVLLTDALDEWTAFCQRYTDRTKKHYISEVEKFINSLPDNVVFITDLTKLDINSYLNSYSMIK